MGQCGRRPGGDVLTGEMKLVCRAEHETPQTAPYRSDASDMGEGGGWQGWVAVSHGWLVCSRGRGSREGEMEFDLSDGTSLRVSVGGRVASEREAPRSVVGE